MTRLNRAEGFAQIDALTRGVRLPVKAMRPEHLRILAAGIREAWQQVKTTQPVWSVTSAEASLNLFMESELNRLRRTNPVWRTFVSQVTRSSESASFDGTLIEKRPDLALHLSDGGRPFPVVVECKLIDAAGDKTVGLYCRQGIDRFVKGDYAWAVTESFMLAYVRDGSDLDQCLFAFLSSADAGRQSYGLVATPDRDSSGSGVSVHSRAFKYPTKAAPEDDPGPISLWHLWLE